MSDEGRKNFTDKVAESAKPEGDKSLWDKTTEAVTDAYDKVAASLQPEEDKSLSQKVGDKLSDTPSNPAKKF